jgi:hypothetical protein
MSSRVSDSSPSPVYSMMVIGGTGSPCCVMVVSEFIRTIVMSVIVSVVPVGRPVRRPLPTRGERPKGSPWNTILGRGQQCKSECLTRPSDNIIRTPRETELGALALGPRRRSVGQRVLWRTDGHCHAARDYLLRCARGVNARHHAVGWRNRPPSCRVMGFMHLLLGRAEQ